MVDLKTLSHKTSVDSKLLKLGYCQRNIKEERAPLKFSPVFIELTKRFGSPSGDKIVIPEDL